MNDTQSLELQLKTTGEETLKVLNRLQDSILGIDSKLEKTLNTLSRFSSTFTKMFNVSTLKKTVSEAMKFLDNATSRAEELNLFNVIFKNIEKNGSKTFSTLGLQATRFQYKLNEAFGTNMTETLRYQGLFQAMATNVGIDDKYANIMSETMTKLTYDLASLYNRSEKTTAEALRGGVYAGQTKPLRNFGIDVTQNSLKPVLESLGITDRTFSQMNQAEREILRYIATLQQAKSAMGDFAETIESPANQLKIFKQQIVEAKVSWGNLFMGMYSNMLPYANAILMVLKEIAKSIANIFGIEVTDYNTGLADTEDIYTNIEKGANGATKATKELKRQILSFDQIHNVTTPTNDGSSSGSGNLQGGIDQRLLDAIQGYDNLMDKVKMKATEIRDRWMEILGFKKEINPLTGEIYFTYQGFGTTLKNLVKWYKGLNGEAQLFVKLGLIVTVVSLANAFKKLYTVITASKLLSSSSQLLSFAKLGVQVNGDLTSGLKDGITAWRQETKIIDTSKSNLSNFTKVANGAIEALKGLAIAAVGLSVVKMGIEDINKSGITAKSTVETLGGTVMTVFGAAQAGAVFGPYGAAAGAAVGAIAALITAVSNYKTELDKKIDSIKDKTQEFLESQNKIKEAMALDLVMPNTYQNYLDELDTIVDKNGKIKDGYESRVQFIATKLKEAYGIELEIINGTIKGYDKQIEKIQELIDAQRREIKLNYAKQSYEYAMNNYDAIYNEKIQAEEALKKAEKAYNEEYESWLESPHVGNSSTYALDKAKQNLEETKQLVEDTTKVYNNNILAIISYEGMVNANTEKNVAAFNEYALQQEMASHKINGTFGKTLAEQVQMAQSHYDTSIEIAKKQGKKITDIEKASANQRYNVLLSYLTNSKNYVEKTATKEQAEAWAELGKQSEERFIDAFKKLDPDIQKDVVGKMYTNGYSVSEELQKGIQALNPNIHFSSSIDPIPAPDTKVAQSSVDSWWSRFKNNMKTSLNSTFPGLGSLLGWKANGGVFNGYSWSNLPQYANGGLPNHGTLFAAGENGAEIVGNINRRTEVLNRSQIASSIYSAVLSAMSQVQVGGGEFHLYAHTDEGVVIDRINQKTKQTGRCPINLPSY